MEGKEAIKKTVMHGGENRIIIENKYEHGNKKLLIREMDKQKRKKDIIKVALHIC